jgi:hypothetical protein
MTSRRVLFLAGVLAMPTTFSGVLTAAERAAVAAATAPNAAVIYWQAFALLPEPLAEPEKKQYDAAVANSAAHVTDDLKPIVMSFEGSLAALRRATRVAACDWHLDYEAGAECQLPHLEKARTLSKAALLRARLEFAAGKADEAIADVIAVLKLARDCGSSPVLVSLLVDAAIEKSATEVLTANLGRLSPEQLDQLAEVIDALPTTPSPADCIRHEGRTFGDWLARVIDAEAATVANPKAGGKVLAALFREVLAGSDADANEAERREMFEILSVADVRESLRLLRAHYESAATIADIPAAERRGRWAEFEAGIPKAGPAGSREQAMRVLSDLLMPAVAGFCDAVDAADVRRQLLLLAIKVQRRGADAIRGSAIPGHGPVEYRATGAGFELRCQPGSTDKPVVLQVGHASP